MEYVKVCHDKIDMTAMERLEVVCRERGYRLVQVENLGVHDIRVDGETRTIFVTHQASCCAITNCTDYISTRQSPVQ